MLTESIQAMKPRPDRHVFARRLALFLSMLISGGLLLFPREPILLMVIVLCLVATGFRHLPLRRSMWPLFALLTAVFVVTLVRPGPVSFDSLVSRFANFIGALLLLNVYLRAAEGALARDLQFILRWMALQAIVTVVLAHTLGFLFVPITFSGQDYYRTLLLLFNYHAEGAGGLIRPNGFFWEPGVFQIYLNLYLYLAIFVYRNPGQIVLAILAVLSTQSTTGMLICIILLGAAFAQHLSSGGIRRKVVAILVAIVVAPPILYLGYDNVTDKLFGVTQRSSWAREFDFYTGLNVIAENPLLGIGFDVERYLSVSGRLGYSDTMLDSKSTEDRPTTNGLIHLFYSLGIPLALTFMAGMFRQTLFRHRLLIGLWLSLSLFGEAILFTPFFMFIIFSAFVVRASPSHASAHLARDQAA